MHAIQNTGLKYTIGDALGVFGHNADEDVRDFLAFYGVKEDTIVSAAGAKLLEGRHESRSVFHWLQQVWYARKQSFTDPE